jgi:hypothetical protein
MPGNVTPPCFELKEIIMNTKQLIAAAALTVVGSAALAQATQDEQFGFITASQPSTAARQQIGADLVSARQSGFDSVTGAPIKTQPASQLTRAQVQAELVQARADGSAFASNGFGFVDNNYASARSRDEVRNEAIAATPGKKSGVQAGR